jgi:lysophospholipase L1-like esterase
MTMISAKKRIGIVALVAAAALAVAPRAAAALASTSTTARTSSAAVGGTHYYLALGDSLARSSQPNGDFQHGYAEQLLALLQQQDPLLRLVKLACGGESTATMISGSDDPSCAFPHKTQLAEAVAFLQGHRKFVSLVTIDIGADDVVGGGGVPAVQANLPIILDQLRAAAGPGIPIVGMNYYDPFVADVWFATHDVGQVQAEANFVAAFNTFVLQPIYTAAGVPVADVEARFQVTNTTLVDTDGNGTADTPVDVVYACRWTWECTPPPLGPDPNANTAGYAAIAQAFLDALP